MPATASIPLGSTVTRKRSYVLGARPRPLRAGKAPSAASFPVIQVADAGRARMARAYIRWINAVRDAVPLKDIQNALADRNWGEAVRLLDLESTLKRTVRGAGIPRNEDSFVDAFKAIYREGAKTTLAALDKVPVRKARRNTVGLEMEFDLDMPEAVEFLEDYALDLITNVNSKTLEAIRDVLIRAFQEGGHPFEQARAIRSSIGLTPQQVRAVENYRQALEDGRLGAALDRELRDRRFDSTLTRLLETDEGILSGDQIERMTERYYERMLTYRAEMIARTETIKASQAGQQEVWRQADRQGLLQGARKIWIITDDDVTCILGKCKVMTLDGWKPISRVRVGDMVLTHKDRFRRVLATRKKHYSGYAVRISEGRDLRLTATFGHQVLVGGKWTPIEHVVQNESLIRVLAVPCSSCGKLKPHGIYTRDGGRCQVCAVVACNTLRWSDPKAHADLTAQNLKRWSDPKARRRMSRLLKGRVVSEESRTQQATSLRRRYQTDLELYARMVANNRRTAKDPNHTFKKMTYEQRVANNHKIHVSLGKNSRGNSFLERKLRWFLQEQGITFNPQWRYSYSYKGRSRAGFADFCVPAIRLVIECDGYFHRFSKAKDRAKTASLASQGFTVLRFNEHQIRNEFSDVASAIRSHCCFMDVKLKRKIKQSYINHQPVYDLQVEEDNSFVVGGIVVHNCELCHQVIEDNPDGVPIDGEFDTDDGPIEGPPRHPHCRCTSGLKFDEEAGQEEEE